MRIYPYPVLNGDVTLRIGGVALDSNTVIPEFVDQERRTIGISSIGNTRWKTLSFTVRVDGPVSELAIPDGPWTDVTAVVTANCGRSNTRVPVPVDAEPGSRHGGGEPPNWTAWICSARSRSARSCWRQSTASTTV